jgi:hypothetical protein
MKLFKLFLIGVLLTACGSSRVYHNSISSYEEDITPVKNIFLVFLDAEAGEKAQKKAEKAYKKFEAYLREELNRRGVVIRFFYSSARDSLAESKIRDSAIKYRFDFIIKKMSATVSDNRNSIIVGGRSNTYDGSGINGPITLGRITSEIHFTGFRKKEKYNLVWKCTCENMQENILQAISKTAGECLVKSLAEQKLIPSEENKR